MEAKLENEKSTQAIDQFDYYYREYVRINEICGAMATSSFEDFKLLGAIGAVLLWPPIANMDFLKSNLPLPSYSLLFGFVAIVTLVTLIAVRDLLKQSLIFFHLREMRIYEKAIRGILSPSLPIFQTTVHWNTWGAKHQRFMYSLFCLVFLLVLAIFPAVVLSLQGLGKQIIIYEGVLLAMCVLYGIGMVVHVKNFKAVQADNF